MNFLWIYCDRPMQSTILSFFTNILCCFNVSLVLKHNDITHRISRYLCKLNKIRLRKVPWPTQRPNVYIQYLFSIFTIYIHFGSVKVFVWWAVMTCIILQKLAGIMLYLGYYSNLTHGFIAKKKKKKKNKATWCWHEPTCLLFYINTDLDLWPCPFTLTSRICHRRTDGQTDGQKATPKSPLCMSKGGLKNKQFCKILVPDH